MIKKHWLTVVETAFVTSMLFGLFFGAGNLIFPAFLGQAAGYNVYKALGGFLVTGVGLPLLAVTAIAITESNGLLALSQKVSRKYSYIFTCTLYLTIGPFFAIPRCITVPFETGILPNLPAGMNPRVGLLVFSLIFFAIMLFFSLRQGKLLLYIGKVLNPLFLLTFLFIMIIALLHPAGTISEIAPTADYVAAPFIRGVLEGYNTMDALAGLAFGIVIIEVVQQLGVTDSKDVAFATFYSGLFACLLMAAIYLITAVVGAQSRGMMNLASNGGAALVAIVRNYFPGIGSYLFALMIFLACIKTAVGLITSCSETFVQMFPHSLPYRVWAIIFSVISAVLANIGLSGIIKLSIPVLMLLYPLSIMLIVMGLTERIFKTTRTTYKIVIGVTLIFAIGDFINALPAGARLVLHLNGILTVLQQSVPLFSIGLGWLLPAVLAFVVSYLVSVLRSLKQQQQ